MKETAPAAGLADNETTQKEGKTTGGNNQTSSPGGPGVKSSQTYTVFEEPGVFLGVLIDPARIQVSMLKSRQALDLAGAVRETQSTMQASKDETLAIVTPSYYETSNRPTYEVTLNEEVLAPGAKKSPWTLWIGTDHKAHIEPTADYEARQPNRHSRPGVEFAIGTKPLKIENGVKLDVQDKASHGNKSRTVAALTKDGRLIFATFEASGSAGRSQWMTYERAADLLMEQARKMETKIDKMLLLDGGGSAKIWIAGDPPKSFEADEEKGGRKLNYYIILHAPTESADSDAPIGTNEQVGKEDNKTPKNPGPEKETSPNAPTKSDEQNGKATAKTGEQTEKEPAQRPDRQTEPKPGGQPDPRQAPPKPAVEPKKKAKPRKRKDMVWDYIY
jgi:hypothetical protein